MDWLKTSLTVQTVCMVTGIITWKITLNLNKCRKTPPLNAEDHWPIRLLERSYINVNALHFLHVFFLRPCTMYHIHGNGLFSAAFGRIITALNPIRCKGGLARPPFGVISRHSIRDAQTTGIGDSEPALSCYKYWQKRYNHFIFRPWSLGK